MENPLPSLDFKKESEQLSSLIGAWSDEKSKCDKRRELRENRRDVAEERRKGTILEDETIIPDRTINSNIKRSKVPFSNYVFQAKRTLIITDIERPTISIEPLETWFTRGMRYPNWKQPWNRLIDSMHVHGGAALEVVADASKPLGCALEYVPREDLIFSLKSKSLQNNPRILRVYEVSAVQLEQWVKNFEFDERVAKELFDKFSRQEDFIKIYRVLMKINTEDVDGISSVVYNAWYADKCDIDWLRAPRIHDIGLFSFDTSQLLAPVEVPPQQLGQPPGVVPLFLSPEWETVRTEFAVPAKLKDYPLIWFPFQEIENEKLLDVQGRVSLDIHVQEAMTQLYSDTVNGAHRASRFYPCAEDLPGGDEKLAELGPLKHGVVLSRKIAVFQPNWPNNIALAILQALKVGKADESGQMDFAATARKDANKTAKEMTLATEQSNMVVSVDMDVFSSPVLLTYALCFNIACHQAIFRLCKQPPKPELLIGDYTLQAAGDVEVVKRAEDKQNAKEFFNIVQGTPAAEKVLTFLIERFFPDQADEWIAALSQPDLKVLVAELLNILKTLPLDGLFPEQISNLRMVIDAAQSVVGVADNGKAPGQSGGAQASGPQQVPQAQQA